MTALKALKALRMLLATVLTVALLGATMYGAGWAMQHYQADVAASGSGPAAAPAGVDAPADATPDPSAAPTSEAPAGPVLAPGARGEQVRELQHRLFQLDWFAETTTGVYGPGTRAAVRGFQDKRGLPATGIVDRRTWARLGRMTKMPTRDQLLNILRPGPALLARGDSGEDVRALQARLAQIAWWSGDVGEQYDAATVAAVRGFQEKREIPVTGEVDQRTMDRLVAMTYEPTHDQLFNIEPEPGALDPRCTTGRALCIDKSTNSLRWVVDGSVRESVDVRFGRVGLETREGAFSVFSKSRDHVSSIYETSMPFAMFFSGGQAVHYSPDFAANGYNGASHGCVNVRDYDAIAALFDQVAIGDKVIVYWS
ncbi:L,D-transpeptidase family protein [Nocardioides pacificus]